jgi:hypothetical protein
MANLNAAKIREREHPFFKTQAKARIRVHPVFWLFTGSLGGSFSLYLQHNSDLCAALQDGF